jgi:hypothetical protein
LVFASLLAVVLRRGEEEPERRQKRAVSPGVGASPMLGLIARCATTSLTVGS